MEGSHAFPCSLMTLAATLVSTGKYRNTGTLMAPGSVHRKGHVDPYTYDYLHQFLSCLGLKEYFLVSQGWAGGSYFHVTVLQLEGSL